MSKQIVYIKRGRYTPHTPRTKLRRTHGTIQYRKNPKKRQNSEQPQQTSDYERDKNNRFNCLVQDIHGYMARPNTATQLTTKLRPRYTISFGSNAIAFKQGLNQLRYTLHKSLKSKNDTEAHYCCGFKYCTHHRRLLTKVLIILSIIRRK